jgi:Na+-transporting NADH:ubiquinone oxidoreductase subunit B
MAYVAPAIGSGPASFPLHGPHLRRPLSLHRVMVTTVLALLPALLLGLYNTGLQAAARLTAAGLERVPGWRGPVQAILGAEGGAAGVWDAVVLGGLYVLPALAVSLVAGGAWEAIFAIMRRRHRTEGLLVSALVFTLMLPAAAPLWQVALGMSFGIVFGKEIFGGTGRNVIHPALAGLAFLYLSFPDAAAGDPLWAGTAGYAGSTLFAVVSREGMGVLTELGQGWNRTFFGIAPGTMGAGSAMAALLGAMVLARLRIVSWRVMVAVCAGMVAAATAFNLGGGPEHPIMGMPWYWHFVIGSFAFGMVFVATDPATAAMTNPGRWVYGFLIGAIVVLIRVVNTQHPDGVVLALLLGNVSAPLIDYGVMWVNMRRREVGDG